MATSGATGRGDGGYTFPPFHSFPPSYTLQPVEATRAKQTQLWCDLIRDYCRVHHIFWLDISRVRDEALFRNDKISRRLSDKDILYFLGQLVGRGDAEWSADHKNCLVYWRRPREWGELIFRWVQNNAYGGQVLTVGEIRNGKLAEGQEFFDLELDTTVRALEALQLDGKCVLIQGDAGDALGAKFIY